MKRLIYLSLLILLCNSFVFPQEDNDIIYQTSTIGALMEGIYDGNMTFKELKNHGDFGLGTINNLDGEMIALNDTFYQVKSDGKVYKLDELQKTPFAVVTTFSEDFSLTAENADIKKLEKIINKNIPSKNLFYAISITGKFSYVKTRSVPGQSKPYPRLVEATKNQAVFEYKNLEGTLIGFRIPDYANGINVGGYHFHFLSNDRNSGGHLLDCVLKEGKISIDQKMNILIGLPSTADFYNVNLSSDKQQEIIKIEK
jgi:acetolactate decarboxylase